MASTITYTTIIEGKVMFKGESLEFAVRTWDANTYNLGRSVEGAIEVQEVNAEGVMVRDGWILHVRNGTVYLNPNIR